MAFSQRESLHLFFAFFTKLEKDEGRIAEERVCFGKRAQIFLGSLFGTNENDAGRFSSLSPLFRIADADADEAIPLFKVKRRVRERGTREGQPFVFEPVGTRDPFCFVPGEREGTA